MKPFEDPSHEFNSSYYHTGKLCKICNKNPAGTAWSPYFVLNAM